MEPITMAIILGAAGISRWLNSSKTITNRCVMCEQREGTMRTQCCQTSLCPDCVAIWKADPDPCPCKRR